MGTENVMFHLMLVHSWCVHHLLSSFLDVCGVADELVCRVQSEASWSVQFLEELPGTSDRLLQQQL